MIGGGDHDQRQRVDGGRQAGADLGGDEDRQRRLEAAHEQRRVVVLDRLQHGKERWPRAAPACRNGSSHAAEHHHLGGAEPERGLFLRAVEALQARRDHQHHVADDEARLRHARSGTRRRRRPAAATGPASRCRSPRPASAAARPSAHRRSPRARACRLVSTSAAAVPIGSATSDDAKRDHDRRPQRRPHRPVRPQFANHCSVVPCHGVTVGNRLSLKVAAPMMTSGAKR